MEMKDITIIIPTRTNLPLLKGAVQSIRNKPQYNDCQILIGADTPTKDVSEWLEQNLKHYKNSQYRVFKDAKRSRIGIVEMVESLVKETKTSYIFYMHDDMRIGNHTLTKLMEIHKDKYILSSRRVEPPLYPETPEKWIRPFGFDEKDFNNEGFLAFEEQNSNTDKTVEGFFAPHFFAKKDWIGYDPVFAPQSREDSDLAQRFIDAECKLITVNSSIVYHFSGKGSRKKDGNDKDSEEWKRSNSKNERNYIRKWGTLAHTEYIYPIRTPTYKISAHVLVGDEAERLPKFIANVEPYFDEIVFVIDRDQPDKVKTECAAIINSYATAEYNNGPTNFKPSKFIIAERSLKRDFASQTNYAIGLCSNEWTIKLDVDEVFPVEFLAGLRFCIDQSLKQNPNLTVLGFTRINSLDGKISNDIPREHWFTDEFDKYPTQVNEVNNPDVQFRLSRKDVKWVGKVHEVPECVIKNDRERVNIVSGIHFFHPKDRQRQFNQEQLYQKINKENKPIIKQYVYDSVIYTVEGITEHARQEVKELKRRGNKVFLLDTNYREGFGDYLTKCYDPISVEDKETVVIINQPPSRWERSMHYPNKVGFLAFEGQLPKEWVETINKSSIKELWTPSTYCEKIFKMSGVKKPLFVIPHGIDSNIWYPRKEYSEKIKNIRGNADFMFLAVGTYHNNRKGLDVVLKAFQEAFKKDQKVKLVFKVNKIYNPNEGFAKYLKPYWNFEGSQNIEYIDDDLTEDELAQLFSISDCYVSAHRAEGFGINILNAQAVGTTVIATEATGNLDFCNKDNCFFIKVKKEIYAPWVHPYERSKWAEPDVKSLEEQMSFVKNLGASHKALKMLSTKNIETSERVHRDWSWQKTVDKIESRVQEIF